MKTKEVILKNKNQMPKRNPFAGSFSFGRNSDMEPPVLSVEVEELDTRDLPLLSRDSDVVAFAPVMPMKLIEPVKVQLSEAMREQSVTWGIRATGADTCPFSGNGVVVAVLDTGIDSKHKAFDDVQLIQRDFTGDGDGDPNGHGTHCAGTIFGRDIQGIRIGVAKGVKKALIGKVLGNNGGGSTEQIMSAIMWALESGAHIISMSLGMDFPGYVRSLTDLGYPAELATSRALEAYRANTQLFERLASLIRANGSFGQSCILIAAAGNESRREIHPDWEIAVAPPAISEGIISVGALGEGQGGLTIANFSNTGANVCGPGVNVVSAETGGGLVALNGTSMAAPHVAGIAAFWAEKMIRFGRLNCQELSARLIGNSQLSPLREDFDPFDVGAGLIRAPQS
ncbi:S8 family serine peptidase [Chitinispirillales bacterium ANBcel5]|uniref:S8 family peptidase n=1 Tax=Cellulosispirillum alkaliphilum TaxID=3039283 RepID=UPI002A57AFD5|nr:S8 family serine peptidase [Chitinispirillales bacterium ANBcel5]